MTPRIAAVGVGGPAASPPPPRSRGSRVPDVGARRLTCFLVRHPRLPGTSEPLAARPTAEDGRPTRAAATTTATNPGVDHDHTFSLRVEHSVAGSGAMAA